MRDKMSEFATSDLYFSAFLKTAGVPFLRAEKKGGARISFVFSSERHNIGELQRNWVDRKDSVSAHTYADEVRGFKALCHNSG